MNSLLLRALKGESTERPPVWLMRQAGRYMQEYRELKEQHGFLGLCRSPELACEVTLQPIRAFNPDAAIIFADILLPAEPLGMPVEFNPGPKVANRIKTKSDVTALKSVDPGKDLHYVLDALRLTAEALRQFDDNKTLLGFAGTPWTMACYLVDQGIFKHFHGTQVFAAKDPSAAHLLLETLSTVTADYLQAQFESGAQAVQLFDSWGGNLSLEDYRKFSLPYIQKIIERVRRDDRPVILYVNGGTHLLPAMLESGADAVSVDWRTSLAAVQTQIAGNQSIRALQGNFDPSHLFLPLEEVKRETRAMIASLPQTSGYIANVGHGILPTTPPENVGAFIEAVKEGWQR